MDYYIKGLTLYFPLWIRFQNKSVRYDAEWKMRRLKVRCYAARLIHLNEYLASFLGGTLADKIDVTELNAVVLNIMPNSWSKEAYVQGFDWKSISFKKVVNMFERREIAESIYKGVV